MTIQPFLQTLKEKIKHLNVSISQIYKADEAALYWKLLPDKTVVRSAEKLAPGRKRITFLVCVNGDGSHKLKPLIIGKATNLRSVKNVNLPVDYNFSKNIWMTCNI
jgi:hypothetical protein